MNSQQNIPSYIHEFQDFQFYIRPEADSNEVIKSFSISTSKEHQYVTISGSTISGAYKGIFELGQNAIKTINRATKQVTGYNSFEQLPKNNNQDCFYFKPPSSLDFPVQFTIDVVYDRKRESSTSGDSSTQQPIETWERDLRYSQTYTTVVKGSWDIWANGLRDYLSKYKS